MSAQDRTWMEKFWNSKIPAIKLLNNFLSASIETHILKAEIVPVTNTSVRFDLVEDFSPITYAVMKAKVHPGWHSLLSWWYRYHTTYDGSKWKWKCVLIVPVISQKREAWSEKNSCSYKIRVIQMLSFCNGSKITNLQNQ